MKIEYTGFKEDVLKKLELGNVSLPLNNSLITGSQNLFGVKAQMQFGKMFVTTIATTQRGKQSSIEIQGKKKENYKIRVSGARYREQLDTILEFMNILLYLYTETYLFKKTDRLIFKEKLKKLSCTGTSS